MAGWAFGGGRGLALLAASAALPLALALRDSLDSFGAEDRSRDRGRDGGRCCCRGPIESQCHWIPERGLDYPDPDQHFELQSPPRSGDGKGDRQRRSLANAERIPKGCPETLGYHEPDYWRARSRFPDELRGLGESCQRGKSPPSSTRKVTVRIHFMRHAWSCGNCWHEYVKEQNFEKNVRPDDDAGYREKIAASVARMNEYQDAQLTEVGILRSRALGGPILRKIVERTGQEPLVLSSSMTRAMETGLHSFPYSAVYPIPYISEHGYAPVNIPLEHKVQRENLQRGSYLSREDLDARLKLDLFPEHHPHRLLYIDKVIRGGSRDESFKVKYLSNYHEFLNFMPWALEQLWSSELKNQKPPQRGAEISVVIASHGDLIGYVLSKACPRGFRWNKLNNEVVVVSYEVDWGAWNARLKSSSTCDLLFESPQDQVDFFPAVTEHLCAGDVNRCYVAGSGFDLQGWLRHDEGYCQPYTAFEGSSILKRDEEEEKGYTLATREHELWKKKQPPQDAEKSWLLEGLLRHDALHSLARASRKKDLVAALKAGYQANLKDVQLKEFEEQLKSKWEAGWRNLLASKESLDYRRVTTRCSEFIWPKRCVTNKDNTASLFELHGSAQESKCREHCQNEHAVCCSISIQGDRYWCYSHTNATFAEGDRVANDRASTCVSDEQAAGDSERGSREHERRESERSRSLELPTLKIFDVSLEKEGPASTLGVELGEDPLSEGLKVIKNLGDGQIPVQVQEGDVIIAVNGHHLLSRSDFLRKLVQATGQVTLTLTRRRLESEDDRRQRRMSSSSRPSTGSEPEVEEKPKRRVSSSSSPDVQDLSGGSESGHSEPKSGSMKNEATGSDSSQNAGGPWKKGFYDPDSRGWETEFVRQWQVDHPHPQEAASTPKTSLLQAAVDTHGRQRLISEH